MIKMDLEQVRAYIKSSSQESKIYIGGDSERFKLHGKWYADYATVVVVQIGRAHV